MADNSGNFWGGFLFGAAVGGVVGALVAIKLSDPESDLIDQSSDRLIDKPQTSNEFARRNLEKKIAQLNAAIDSVSQELASAEGKNGSKQISVESLRDMTVDDK
jgi:gas vesicle protein